MSSVGGLTEFTIFHDSKLAWSVEPVVTWTLASHNLLRIRKLVMGKFNLLDKEAFESTFVLRDYENYKEIRFNSTKIRL